MRDLAWLSKRWVASGAEDVMPGNKGGSELRTNGARAATLSAVLHKPSVSALTWGLVNPLDPHNTANTFVIPKHSRLQRAVMNEKNNLHITTLRS